MDVAKHVYQKEFVAKSLPYLLKRWLSLSLQGRGCSLTLFVPRLCQEPALFILGVSEFLLAPLSLPSHFVFALLSRLGAKELFIETGCVLGFSIVGRHRLALECLGQTLGVGSGDRRLRGFPLLLGGLATRVATGNSWSCVARGEARGGLYFPTELDQRWGVELPEDRAEELGPRPVVGRQGDAADLDADLEKLFRGTAMQGV
jgi:hypothetical protein